VTTPTTPTTATPAGPTEAGRRLLRSSVAVGIGTGASRVTGLLRTIAIAVALGGAAVGDSYNLANNTPNVVYDLVLGGILAATLIPVVVDRFEHDQHRSIDALATVVTLGLAALAIVGTALAPVIIRLYTIGKDPADADQLIAVAVPLLLMFMPQVFFYGLSTLWTALLNAKRSFAVPAFAPVLNNLIVIAMLVEVWRVTHDGDLTIERLRHDTPLLVLLGLGTTAGIAVMALVLWPAMRRADIRLHWRLDWRDPAVSKVARLSVWTLGYVAANQVVFFVMTTLITSVGVGRITAFSLAWQFFQLPYGLFTVSIMTTFTPELATHVTRGDLAGFRRRFSSGLRLGSLVMIPAAIAYLVLAAPAVTALLEHGAFQDAAGDLTASALRWLAVGLPGFAMFLFTMRGFFAFQDTRTPFFLNLIENALQVVLSFALVRPFGLQGVVAAFSISYTLGAGVAVVVLQRRCGSFLDRDLVVGLVRHLVAAVAMGAALLGVLVAFDNAVVRLAAGLVIGGGVYLGVLLLVRSHELTELRTVLRRAPADPEPADAP
jgi:putative peptidoglycan lipid II flippase